MGIDLSRFNWAEYGPGRGSVTPTPNNGLGIAYYGGGKDRPGFALHLSEGLMKELRWVIGDEVSIGVSDDGEEMCVIRCPGRYSIASPAMDRKKALGKVMRGVVKIAATKLPNLERRGYSIERSAIDVDGNGFVAFLK